MHRDILKFHKCQEIRDIVTRHLMYLLDYGPERVLVLYTRGKFSNGRDELLLVARPKHTLDEILALGTDGFLNIARIDIQQFCKFYGQSP